MTIAVIGAMEQEVELLRGALQNTKTETIANSEYTTGTYEGKEVVLLKSGIGKVNAAMSTTILLEKYNPKVVINTGSAGGFDAVLKVGDIVISDEVRHHDVDVTAFGYEIGQMAGMPAAYKSDEKLMEVAKQAVEEVGEHNYSVGLICSGDVFMSNPGSVSRQCEKISLQ